LGHEGRNSNFIQKEPFQKFPLQFSVTSSVTEIFPLKQIVKLPPLTERISQFHDPSLRKNPHFYKKVLLARQGRVPYLIHKQPANKVNGCFFSFWV
jgi:hypothetical protein